MSWWKNVFCKRTIEYNKDNACFKEFVASVPERIEAGDATLIYKGRNELWQLEYMGKEYVVKSFCYPHFINRIVYAFFRSSKAQRSYEYAQLLLKEGIHTPYPVGYYTVRRGFLFSESYYVCEKSICPYTYAHLLNGDVTPTENILRAIARTTAHLHEKGMLHKDYSRGNILFKEEPDGGVHVEIIDLNRIRFMHVGMELGCKNFERLPGTKRMYEIFADEYALVRGGDKNACLSFFLKYVQMS
jgi:tRNA A-37 threonylcarbamoyl transferase component Bud32